MELAVLSVDGMQPTELAQAGSCEVPPATPDSVSSATAALS